LLISKRLSMTKKAKRRDRALRVPRGVLAMPAAAAAAPVSYSDMTLEDYLMRYCDEQVRAPPPPAPARLSLPPAPSPSAADTARGTVLKVAKIEQEAEANATKLRCATDRWTYLYPLLVHCAAALAQPPADIAHCALSRVTAETIKAELRAAAGPEEPPAAAEDDSDEELAE
jgi:hypothetical protein